MPIRYLLCKGVGFSPGSTAYMPVHGFLPLPAASSTGSSSGTGADAGDIAITIEALQDAVASLSSVSDFILPDMSAPQQVPGGQFISQMEEDRWNKLRDALNLIVDNLQVTINFIIGSGDGARYSGGNAAYVVGNTTLGREIGDTENITGTCGLRLHSSGQLILVWREYTGAGNIWQTFAIKAAAPYTKWTNLAGNSADPTIINPGIPEASNNKTLYICNPETASIHFFFQDNGTGDLLQVDYDFDGENFTESTVGVVLAGLTTDVWFGDIVYSGRSLLMGLRDAAANVAGRIYRATAISPRSWGEVAKFQNIYFAGTAYGGFTSSYQRQFVDLGDGRLLHLMEIVDSGGNNNLAWVMSGDSGLTWPLGDPTTLTVRELNYEGQASGVIFPQTSAVLCPTANMVLSGHSKVWHAAHIEGTSRVGLTYLAYYDVDAGSYSGVMYCEFDADTSSWTTPSDHVLLTPQNLSYNGANYTGLWAVQGGANAAANAGGQYMVGVDGVPRPLWVHGFRDANGFEEDTPLAIATRRIDAGDDITESQNWHSIKEIYQFYPLQGTSLFRQVNFEGCRDGIVTIDNVDYVAVTWSRRLSSLYLTNFSAEWEILFKLIPIAAMNAS